MAGVVFPDDFQQIGQMEKCRSMAITVDASVPVHLYKSSVNRAAYSPSSGYVFYFKGIDVPDGMDTALMLFFGLPSISLSE
jgi:hypothetical protein